MGNPRRGPEKYATLALRLKPTRDLDSGLAILGIGDQAAVAPCGTRPRRRRTRGRAFRSRRLALFFRPVLGRERAFV